MPLALTAAVESRRERQTRALRLVPRAGALPVPWQGVPTQSLEQAQSRRFSTPLRARGRIDDDSDSGRAAQATASGDTTAGADDGAGGAAESRRTGE